MNRIFKKKSNIHKSMFISSNCQNDYDYLVVFTEEFMSVIIASFLETLEYRSP